jgi:hypothetical protein
MELEGIKKISYKGKDYSLKSYFGADMKTFWNLLKLGYILFNSFFFFAFSRSLKKKRIKSEEGEFCPYCKCQVRQKAAFNTFRESNLLFNFFIYHF